MAQPSLEAAAATDSAAAADSVVVAHAVTAVTGVADESSAAVVVDGSEGGR